MSSSIVAYLLLSTITIGILAGILITHERRKKTIIHSKGVVEYIQSNRQQSNIAEVKFEDEDPQFFEVKKSQWGTLKGFRPGDFITIQVTASTNRFISAKKLKTKEFRPLLRLSETIFHSSTQ